MTQYVDIQGEPLAVQIYEPKNPKADVVPFHGFTVSKEGIVTIELLIAP